jgi:hypothetical protein
LLCILITLPIVAGTNLTLRSDDLYMISNTQFRLAASETEAGTTNIVIITQPAENPQVRSSETKENYKDMQDKMFGECASRDNGIDRAFARYNKDAKKQVMVQVQGVQGFTNTEWQTEDSSLPANPYLLRTEFEMCLCEDGTPMFVAAAEIAHKSGVEDISDEEDDQARRESKLEDLTSRMDEMGIGGFEGGRGKGGARGRGGRSEHRGNSGADGRRNGRSNHQRGE